MATRVLWSVGDLNWNIGNQVIFDHAAMAVHEGERLALVGRNGCGKTTLLKIIQGHITPREGKIAVARDLRIAALDQEFTLPGEQTVLAAVQEGQKHVQELLKRYEKGTDSAEHAAIEHHLTLHDAWHPEAKLSSVLDKLKITRTDVPVAALSGGEKRRVALARAIVSEPDLLLLDEPTNHLDVETVGWIEDFLADYRGTCLLVTHDRYFLDRVATRILELDHGHFYSTEGSYADFLAAKAERETNADLMEQKRRHFLRSEIEWVRRSPKARLRRNLGRLRRYQEVAAQNAPERDGEVELILPRAPRMGNLCINLEHVAVSLGGRKIFGPLDLEIAPGRKIGVVGANGTGKTTLLRVLTGELAPDAGTVKIAPTVVFNYVDQNKLVLNQEATVYEEIAEGVDHLDMGGNSITVRAYLRRFLFEDDRINSRIKYLSGGEKARLTLAKMLKKGGNTLILDEPTNDLDLSTLRLLEEALAAYDGTVVAVSHDRYFLNRFCDGIIGFDGRGGCFFTPGDYDYYLVKKAALAGEGTSAPAKKAAPAPAPKAVPEAPRRRAGLTFREQRELRELEEKIPVLEAKIAELEAIFQDADFYRKYGARTAELTGELNTARSDLDTVITRWLELAEKQN